jgi:hypothetical protein
MASTFLGAIKNVRHRRMSSEARDLIIFDDCLVVVRGSNARASAMAGGSGLGLGGVLAGRARGNRKDKRRIEGAGAMTPHQLLSQHTENQHMSYGDIATVKLSKKVMAPALDVTFSNGASDHWMWDRGSNKTKDVEALLDRALGAKLAVV